MCECLNNRVLRVIQSQMHPFFHSQIGHGIVLARNRDRQISQAENSLIYIEFQASQGYRVRPCVKTYKPELERCLHKPVS